jgi:hypothetical protein
MMCATEQVALPTMAPSPLTLRVASAYLLTWGALGLASTSFKLGPHHREFQTLNKAARLGPQTREVVLSIACIVAGVGILAHQGWGRVLAFGVLAVSTVYHANAFAWGFSGGPPGVRSRWFSRVILVAWNGAWFYLIYRVAV